MDYEILAAQLVNSMQKVFMARKQKRVNEGMRGEPFILHFIDSKKDEVMPGEISSAMNISSARIANALNSLEAKGLVSRKIDASDRRRILVSLTEKGRSAAAEKKSHLLKEMAEILKLLDEDEAKEYVRITSKLATLIKPE